MNVNIIRQWIRVGAVSFEKAHVKHYLTQRKHLDSSGETTSLKLYSDQKIEVNLVSLVVLYLRPDHHNQQGSDQGPGLCVLRSKLYKVTNSADFLLNIFFIFSSLSFSLFSFSPLFPTSTLDSFVMNLRVVDAFYCKLFLASW